MANPEPNRRVGIEVRATTGPGILHQLTGVIADGTTLAISIASNSSMESPIDTLVFRNRHPRRRLGAGERSRSRLLVWSAHAALVDTMQQIYGKRIIIVGGGAQVGQVALGAIIEADRHNIRGEHISIDTIPLVGEKPLANAVRAAARLPRVKAIVMAGSLMGGEIEQAVRDVRAQGLLVVSLNMAGSVPDAADLVCHRSRAGRRHDRDGRGRYGEVYRGPVVSPEFS